MSKRISASARVQITVEVQTSAWGSDCSIEQLFKQAAESGIQTLIATFKYGEHGRITIIGEPKVIGVITESLT